MKNAFFLLLVFIAVACKNTPPKPVQKYIEPCKYSAMSYQVTDTSYHGTIMKLLSKDSYITVKSDSIFNVTEKLGQFLFGGTEFTYKALGDSLILRNNDVRFSCKVLEIAPNSFQLELNNKYLKTIFFIKPKDERRKITKEVNIAY